MEESREDIQVLMPKSGGMVGTIGRWCKHEGDLVSKGEIVVEIVTEKVTIEVESPTSGVLLRRLYEIGSTVPTGNVIAIIKPVDEALLPVPIPPPKRTRRQRTLFALRIGLRSAQVLLFVVGILFFVRRGYQIAAIIVWVALAPEIIFYLYRKLASLIAWLKKRRSQP